MTPPLMLTLLIAGVASISFQQKVLAETATSEPTSYSEWAELYDLNSGKNGDDDSDGVSNLIEFATGTSPTSRASTSPGLELTQTSTGYELVHPRRKDSLITYNIETNTDLGNRWTDITEKAASTTISDTDTFDITKYTFTSISDRRFIRLRIDSENNTPAVSSVSSTLSLQGTAGIERYTIEVSATDDDRDVLTYSFEVISGGGTISGQIGSTAYYEHDSTGEKVIRITVSDGIGEDTVYDYTFEIASYGDNFYTNEEDWATATNGAQQEAYKFVIENPNLPYVLLIGDSISIGYTSLVQDALSGEANVYRIPINGGEASKGINRLDLWLSEINWDVVHFNFGLHDIKYLLNGAITNPEDGGVIVSTEEEYQADLETLFSHISTHSQVKSSIWAHTTMVQETAVGRVSGQANTYNSIASEILADYPGIATNDLHTVSSKNSFAYSDDGVHFTDYSSLAERVAVTIRSSLAAQP